jgi:hypothetical protein
VSLRSLLGGPHDIDASPANDRQQINFWPGLNAPEAPNRTVSGSDAGRQTQWAELHPEIKINRAIKWRALVHLGRWDFGDANATGPGMLSDSEYPNSRRRGVWRSMTPFYVNYWRMKVKLPWDNLSIGKRPSGFGIGLMNSGKYHILKTSNSTSNSVSLTAPYGPFLIGISFYPNRRGSEGYYNDIDRTNIRWANFAYGAAYRSGDLITGFAIGHAYRHGGGERRLGNATNTRDRTDLDLGWYMKYNNGRFFFNAEFRWYDRRDVHTDGNRLRDTERLYFDQELRAWAVEGGRLLGPSKISVLVADVSGPDRRAYGAWGNSSTFKTNMMSSISGNFSNGSLFLPYSYLMVYTYGSGTPGNGQDGKGYFYAGRFCGCRLDWAVACDLNVFVTYCKAYRQYKGFGWGYINVDADGDVGYAVLDPGPGADDGSPAIPDDDLGWEPGTGIDWKPLEGFTMYGRLAYFQPGKWWSSRA